MRDTRCAIRDAGYGMRDADKIFKLKDSIPNLF
jgi:hypothetical protein